MFGSFVRSEDSNYPQTYHSFFAKKLDSDELVTYHIADLLEEHTEETLDIFKKNFIPDEVFNMSVNIIEKPNAMALLEVFYKIIIRANVSLGCFNSETGELVAVNLLLVKTKGEKQELNIEDPDLLKVLDLYFFVESQCDVAEHYGVDQYLYGAGLAVKSEYRGRGIATEMLKARVPLLKSLGLKVTSTVFTMLGSQKAAASAGYDELYAISYEELKEKYPHLDFSGANSSHCKTQGTMIE